MGYLVSFMFVFLIIGISTILEKKKILGSEGTRKIIHIGVCNWWFIAMYYFYEPIVALIPACFILINYVSYQKNIFTAMERREGVKDLGTVYYSISLFILSIWTFSIGRPEIGLMGILIMGYGDGLAAIIGKKYGKKPFFLNKEKSIPGSLTVFFVSLIIAFLILNFYYDISFGKGFAFSLLIAILASLIEAITPLGFDNLTLPLSTSIVFYLITQMI